MGENQSAVVALAVIGNIRERIEAQLEIARRHPDFCLVENTPESTAIGNEQGASAQARQESGGYELPKLEDIYQKTRFCQGCPLHMSRKNFVFGEGNPHAALMFVGEAPGADEDEQGRPFVGKAGQLLTRIIEAMRLKREDVYICNILKCRPPGNRNPLPEEIAACLPTLLRQIEAIKPRIICTLGSVPTHVLLEGNAPISVLRGRFLKRGDIKIMPTFHPAYLLRNPQAKKMVWEDMQSIMRELGLGG